MPNTEQIKQRTISRDAIAGADLHGQISSIARSIDRVETTIVQQGGQSNAWKKFVRYTQVIARNIKLWIMDEQLTAVASRANVFNLSGLAFNTDTWVSLIAFHNLVSFTLYTIRDQHYFFDFEDSGYDVFVSPVAGDYTFNLYAEFSLTGVTQNDFYVTLLLSTKQNNGTLWSSTPLVVGGGTNINIDPSPTTFIQASGTHVLRLGRGDKVRFGIKNIARSGAAINSGDITSSQYRVSIVKNKFNPTLEV